MDNSSVPGCSYQLLDEEHSSDSESDDPEALGVQIEIDRCDAIYFSVVLLSQYLTVAAR